MTLNVLFSADAGLWGEYQEPLANALAGSGLDARLGQNFEPSSVNYIVFAPGGPVSDFTPFTRAKAVLSLWAGVEGIVSNATLNIPLTRMVDRGLAEGMVEWVTGHVLRHHLGIDAHLRTRNGIWDPVIPPLARHRNVGILGLGALGMACAKALSALNFNVSGWSRTPKSASGITCLSGTDGLGQILGSSEILVLLLPATAATENLINGDRLAKLPSGAVLLNPGRGALIDDAALLAALDGGRLANATLDAFRTEPLPHDHPFWAIPGSPLPRTSPRPRGQTRRHWLLPKTSVAARPAIR